jgi:ubiquinone/menaquinone biosynthesis C-methylase UbiE
MSDSQLEYWRRYWDERAKNTADATACVRGSSLAMPQAWDNAMYGGLRRLVGDLSDLSLFDAGCGTGDLLDRLDFRTARQYVGMDLAPTMMARFAAAHPEPPCPTELLTGSVTEIPWPDASCDRVVCISTLHYLAAEQQRQAMQEMMRILKPGGRLVMIVKNASSIYAWKSPLDRLKQVAKRLLGRPVAPGHVYQPFAWYKAQLAALGTVEDAFSLGWWRPTASPHQIRRLAGWEGSLAASRPTLHRRLARFGVESFFSVSKQALP